MASGKSKTLYQLLGVKRSASKAAIKRAFYRVRCAALGPKHALCLAAPVADPASTAQKAKRYHPDMSHEDPQTAQVRRRRCPPRGHTTPFEPETH